MKTAMILAAGRGTRLRPLTDRIPKALCKVHGLPLIEHHIRNLAIAGFKNIVINHAYLGSKIRQHLGSGKQFGVNIIYSPEPTGGLETGGGIVNALHLLGEDIFLTVNADIYTNYDFSKVAIPEDSAAHFVLIDKPDHRPHSDFGLSETNQVENENKRFTFSGIACYHPKLFKQFKPGRFSIAPMLAQLANDKLASGELFKGQWFDIGSPERLELANKSKPFF